jgi:hypothetical protein
LIKRLPAQAPEFLNVSILYPIENTDVFRDFEFLGIRPEQLPCCFIPYGKKLDKMVVLQPVTFRTKKSLICIKSFGQLTAMSFIKTYRNRLLQDIRNNSIRRTIRKI